MLHVSHSYLVSLSFYHPYMPLLKICRILNLLVLFTHYNRDLVHYYTRDILMVSWSN